jgi:hypothetical protein
MTFARIVALLDILAASSKFVSGFLDAEGDRVRTIANQLAAGCKIVSFRCDCGVVGLRVLFAGSRGPRTGWSPGYSQLGSHSAPGHNPFGLHLLGTRQGYCRRMKIAVLAASAWRRPEGEDVCVISKIPD